MYAKVRRYEGVRTDPTQVREKVNQGFKPIIDAEARFKAYCWVDAGNGVMISTSVFADQSSADELDKRAYDNVQNLAQLLPNPPQFNSGEVVAYHDTGEETGIPIDGGTSSAIVRRYERVTDPSETGRRVNEGFVPTASGIQDLDCYCLVDAGGGVMIATSVFLKQAGAEPSVPLLPNPTQTTPGKVVAFARPKR
jgi:hypothetical protein